MKKIMIFSLCFSLLLFTGCAKNKTVKVDYSNVSFTRINWNRNGDHDLDTIRFNADGSFSYSCACGNPVNDADLCERYIYSAASNEITLKCVEKTDDMVTTIKVVNVTDTTLELDFNGEIRIFEKEK